MDAYSAYQPNWLRHVSTLWLECCWLTTKRRFKKQIGSFLKRTETMNICLIVLREWLGFCLGCAYILYKLRVRQILLCIRTKILELSSSFSPFVYRSQYIYCTSSTASPLLYCYLFATDFDSFSPDSSLRATSVVSSVTKPIGSPRALSLL